MTGNPAVSAVQQHEHVLLLTLLELAIIVAAGRLGGIIARRVGQSAAVGEIIAGILLGPSLFGWAAPRWFELVFRSAPPAPLEILSSLGLILLMFQIGLEFDFSQLARDVNRRAVVRTALACLALPFASGLALGLTMPGGATLAARCDTALFVATAFSITALPILGRIMIDLGMNRTRLGVIAISAAALNDVVGWLLLALITTLTVSNFNARAFALRILLVAVFALVSLFAVRPVLKRIVRASDLRGGHLPDTLLAALIVAIFAGAMVTSRIGIFAIFGGFMMGVILFDELELVAAWRERVGHLVAVLFVPIFFTYTGLRTSIGGLDSASDWGWCAAIVLVASLSKIAGGYWAARRSGFDPAQSTMLGFLMNTRALMELIVVNVGLDLGVISAKLFTMLVIMAIISTVATTPALRRLLTSARRASLDASAPPAVPRP
jgi:Kef-type K+ transport system membrane component KefB